MVDLKLTYPSGLATVVLINGFHIGEIRWLTSSGDFSSGFTVPKKNVDSPNSPHSDCKLGNT
ncbi:YELLOW STRIPE like 1, partial [Prunus dulcis]